MSHLQQWTAEAFSTLERARELSALAQIVLESTQHVLTDQLPKKLNLCVKDVDKVKDHHANVSALLEHLRAKVKEMRQTYVSLYSQRLEPAMGKLDSIIALLEKTHIPEFLVSEKRQTLGDFVSRAEIDLLKRNVKIYKHNSEGCVGLLQRHIAQLTLAFQELAPKYAEMTETYDAHLVAVQLTIKMHSKDHNLVASILKENSLLEQELVHLLELLTKHYDQCVLGLRHLDSGKVDSEVLRQDSQELPGVLKEFNVIHDIIMNNETRAARYAEQQTPWIESVAAMCEHLIGAYGRFKTENITKFVLLLLSCEEVLRRCPIEYVSSPIDAFVEVVDQLCYHYSQFVAVFKTEFLTELHHEQYVYPRKFLKALEEFFNGPLLQLEEEERARRRNWLRKYGDFIPKEFILPGEANQPSVVQVISEGLEDIQHPNAADNEQRLVAAMAALHST